MKVQLTGQEHALLVKLYRDAQETPVLVYGHEPGQDTSSNAWTVVRNYMDRLGKKYGYDPRTARISADSPEFEADPAVEPA